VRVDGLKEKSREEERGGLRVKRVFSGLAIALLMAVMVVVASALPTVGMPKAGA
jgi:hypothetical protein